MKKTNHFISVSQFVTNITIHANSAFCCITIRDIFSLSVVSERITKIWRGVVHSLSSYTDRALVFIFLLAYSSSVNLATTERKHMHTVQTCGIRRRARRITTITPRWYLLISRPTHRLWQVHNRWIMVKTVPPGSSYCYAYCCCKYIRRRLQHFLLPFPCLFGTGMS